MDQRRGTHAVPKLNVARGGVRVRPDRFALLGAKAANDLLAFSQIGHHQEADLNGDAAVRFALPVVCADLLLRVLRRLLFGGLRRGCPRFDGLEDVGIGEEQRSRLARAPVATGDAIVAFPAIR